MWSSRVHCQIALPVVCLRWGQAMPSHLTWLWFGLTGGRHAVRTKNWIHVKPALQRHLRSITHQNTNNASQARLVVYKPHHRSRRNLQGGKPKVAQSVESSEEPQKTPVVSMAPPQSGPAKNLFSGPWPCILLPPYFNLFSASTSGFAGCGTIVYNSFLGRIVAHLTFSSPPSES